MFSNFWILKKKRWCFTKNRCGKKYWFKKQFFWWLLVWFVF